MSFNLAIMLRESAASAPDAPALYFGDRELSYREVDEQSGRVAASLLARGLRPGEKGGGATAETCPSSCWCTSASSKRA